MPSLNPSLSLPRYGSPCPLLLMCVNCFTKALGHVFKTLIADNYNDFRSWPVDFRWDEVGTQSNGYSALNDAGTAAGVLLMQATPQGSRSGSQTHFLNQIRDLSRQLVSYALAHSLGRWLVYPGSMFITTKALLPMLLEGQALLLDKYKGQRAKLKACDGNEIDTMFMDRRKRPGRQNRGLRLVICCEGNAGFYEMGCLAAPLEAGYSVLGWNHPGFAGSSGDPSPQNDANAMDVVVKYALHRLNFLPECVVIYGWSIGTFTATWATMTYPRLGALVLDAPFDDLMPLALKVLPTFCKGLVEHTVREHFNLNVAEQLCCYAGPVLLIRRTLDEVVNTEALSSENSEDQAPRSIDLEGNRGNYLLLKLLKYRYPRVMTVETMAAVKHWLQAANPEQEAAVCQKYCVDGKWCLTVLQNYKTKIIKSRKKLRWKDQNTSPNPNGPDFPWSVGEDLSPVQQKRLAIFLAQKYMKNVEATHCCPLGAEDFQLPWTL
ncbi:protein ABHD16B [Dromiciops gliroides]|uniref:protein ABHD16B n=1 Tax=Dromiciops gliroides TaxID=33562 RepID=UPI001CC38244|nr:protein ABHD16B [Dromiciops gliroides]